MTLDADPRWEPDVVGTLPEFPIGSIRNDFDEIFLIHGIEHFHWWEAKPLLANIRTALRTGGTLVLEQPNLESVAKAILGMATYSDLWERDTLWALYGAPEGGLMSHKFGYTPTMLKAVLEESGFASDKIHVLEAKSHYPGRDFRIEAVK